MTKLIDTLNMLKSQKNQKLGEKYTEKFSKTQKNKYAKRALYHYDKAEDQKLLATSPMKRKDAKRYIKDRRDEIETARLNDYLTRGTNKEFYED